MREMLGAMTSGPTDRKPTLEEPNGGLRDSYRGFVREFVEGGEPLVPFPLSFPHDDFAKFLERWSACARGGQALQKFREVVVRE